MQGRNSEGDAAQTTLAIVLCMCKSYSLKKQSRQQMDYSFL